MSPLLFMFLLLTGCVVMETPPEEVTAKVAVVDTNELAFNDCVESRTPIRKCCEAFEKKDWVCEELKP